MKNTPIRSGNFFKVWQNNKWGLGYMVLLLKDDVWNACLKLSPSHLSLQHDFRIIRSKCWKTLGFFFNPDFFELGYDYSIHVYNQNFPPKHMIQDSEARGQSSSSRSLVIGVSVVQGFTELFLHFLILIYYGERLRNPWLCCFFVQKVIHSSSSCGWLVQLRKDSWKVERFVLLTDS